MNIFVSEALKQARKAAKNGDVPVGAIIVKDNRIIAKAYNKREKTKETTNHAEIIAIQKACRILGDWRLNKCTMYVTLEPCAMCMGAIKQARIKEIIYCTKRNNNDSYKVKKNRNQNMLENDACDKMLKDFFKDRRK